MYSSLKIPTLDINIVPLIGIGIKCLLCPNDDVEALKFALVSLITTMQIAEEKKGNPNLTIKDFNTRMENISHPKLHEQVENDLLFGEKIRENALNRVERNFRWKTVSQKLKKIYLSLNY